MIDWETPTIQKAVSALVLVQLDPIVVAIYEARTQRTLLARQLPT